MPASAKADVLELTLLAGKPEHVQFGGVVVLACDRRPTSTQWADRLRLQLVAFMTPHPGQDLAWLEQNIDRAVELADAVGGTPAVVTSRLPQEIQDAFAALDLGPAAYPLDQFTPALPQLGDMQPVLEQGWRTNVLEK